MMRSYTIHFNDSVLTVANYTPASDAGSIRLLNTESDVELLLSHKSPLFSANENGRIWLHTNEPERFMEALKLRHCYVPAAGGLVYDGDKRLLMIFRRGKWDLPKGKVDKGEAIDLAAKREVEEETGILVKSKIDFAYTTYHTYNLHGENCLKETSWYRMEAAGGKLNAQTEEDIQEVKWMTFEDFQAIRDDAYPMIKDLVDAEVVRFARQL